MSFNDFELSEFLPYQLATLASEVSKRLAKIYGEKFGLSMPEWRVLVHVARYDKVSVREIHHCVHLEKPSVSRAVAKLVQAGLLAKSTSTRDQRLVELVLTGKGGDVLNGIIPEAMSFQDDLLSHFSESERGQLKTLLSRLEEALGKSP